MLSASRERTQLSLDQSAEGIFEIAPFLVDLERNSDIFHLKMIR